MNLSHRALRGFALALPLLLLSAPPLAAKDKDQTPWLYRGSDVPQDKEWVLGELKNGLRYAVRRNGVPPDQVSIRIRVDAGALNESDSERGYAHLIEHLVFRRSKYLGESEAIPTWQRLGATFGSDTNAETSPTQTVFKLDLPNVTAASLEESFKLLSGMITAPTLSESDVRTEVPIVLAEKRERGGAGERVQQATQRTLYAGTRLADRTPIGTEEALLAANEKAVRAFHQRWYRPENVVIIAAGDVDPARLEALTKKWFGKWKGRGKTVPAPSFGDPLAPAGVTLDTPVGETAVVVEPQVPLGLTYAVMRPWRPVNDTIAYNQGLMTDALAEQLINRRLEARARAGGSFLVADVRQEDVSRTVDVTYVSITPLGDDWRKALSDVRAVIADALATPPSLEEIEREVAEMETSYQIPVEQQALLAGSKVADSLVSAIDIRETVAAPDDVLAIFRKTIPLFTPEAVLAHTRTLFAGTVTRAVLVTPNAGDATPQSLAHALSAPVVADGKSRLAYKPVRFADLPPIGKIGEVTDLSPTGLLNIQQLELANGVKALLWPTQDEPGRLTVKVRFGGGYRAISAADAPYITLGEMALVGSGVASLGQEELDNISTGRKMGFEFGIDDTAFTFSGDTREADLADQLYLFAAKLAFPRWDANPVVRAQAAAKLQYDTFNVSPQGVLERDLTWLRRNRDPRFKTPTPADIQATSAAGFRRVWEKALASGPIEIQLYGDFDRATAVQALRKTFGALPPRPALPDGVIKAPGYTFPAANADPAVLRHNGSDTQAAAIISWPTGGGMAGVRESRQLDILTELFTNRLLDAMREKAGAAYSPQVYSSWPLNMPTGGSVSAMAQLQPSAAPLFFTTAQQIADDLIAQPVTADELARVIEPLRQQVTRAATSSTFFMNQLQGATSDPRRFDAVRSVLPDYTRTSPTEMQALAAKYLKGNTAWRLAVLPEGEGK